MRIAPVFASLLIAAGASAGSIRLRPSVVLPGGAPARLADIAELEGADAQTLGEHIIAPDPFGLASRNGRPWVEIELKDVRGSLEAAGVPLSRHALSGSACTIRFIVEAGSKPGPAAEDTRSRSDEPRVIATAGVPTVRARVAEALAEWFGVSGQDLRLGFDERDRELLDRAELGRGVLVRPATLPGSSRLLVDVRIMAAPGSPNVLEGRTIRVEAQVQRTALVLRQDVRRGAEITPDMVGESRLWMDPSGAPPATSMAEIAGCKARTRLAGGSVLRTDQIESAVMIRRGEMVTVHCIRAGFEVQARARAKADARLGEAVELRLEGSKETFRARVEGPGRATMDLDPAP